MNAGAAVSTGVQNTIIGGLAGDALTTGQQNTVLGYGALTSDTTGITTVAIGRAALEAQNFTGGEASYNTAVGYHSGLSVSTGINNTLIGGLAGDAITTGASNTAVGAYAMTTLTTGADNVAVGTSALDVATTGSDCVAVGRNALGAQTDGANNTAVGSSAGLSITSAASNTMVGHGAGQNTNSDKNTFIGRTAGYNITSGAKNTIIGRFNGNENGLDIRTSSNNIVLSDGDGNPRVRITSNALLFETSGMTDQSASNQEGVSLKKFTGQGLIRVGNTATGGRNCMEFFNGNGQVGTIATSSSATAYNTSSDYRLKENVTELTGATERLKQLKPSQFNFIADADTTVDGFLAHEVSSIVPEAITGTKDAVDDDGNPVYQGIDQSKLVPLLVATIKELEARIATLEG